jgi:hypothetical protein
MATHARADQVAVGRRQDDVGSRVGEVRLHRALSRRTGRVNVSASNQNPDCCCSKRSGAVKIFP